jgi:uncharacterized iron-regulated membrane protein
MKNSTLRSILFWTHLAAGVVAGTVILIMSVTGTLLTFQQSVLGFVERSQRIVTPPAGAAPLDIDVLLERVRAAVSGAVPATVTLESDPDRAVMVALGAQGVVFVDPYSGAVLGTGSPRARAFYRSVTNWHRWLAVEGEGRATARAITGACNAAFLVLAVTGLFLWWPRDWTMRKVGPVLWFRRGLRGKARDFNWHNAIGFWCAPVLVVLTATAMVISYTWASNLVYTLTGSPRPAAAASRGGGAGGGEASAAPRGGREGGRAGEAGTAAPAQASLQALVARAQHQLPTWRTMSVRLPPRPGGAVAFTMSDRNHWNSFARSTLTLNGVTGAEIRWEPYAQFSLGQKVRGWMRFAHTGELGGVAGEAVAGLASLGGAFLVWTGVALALRRFNGWRSRRRDRVPGELPSEEAPAA